MKDFILSYVNDFAGCGDEIWFGVYIFICHAAATLFIIGCGIYRLVKRENAMMVFDGIAITIFSPLLGLFLGVVLLIGLPIAVVWQLSRLIARKH